MKKVVSFFAYLSAGLNISFFGWWIYVATRYDTHEESVAQFNVILPLTGPVVSTLLFLLTIFSLIILARKPYVFAKILAGLQALFVFMYVFGYL